MNRSLADYHVVAEKSVTTKFSLILVEKKKKK